MDEDFEKIRYFSRKSQKTRKKRPLWRKICITMTAIVVSFCAIFIIILNSVSPVIIDFAEAKVKERSIMAVNKAIISVMNSSIKYNDLVEIVKDNSGVVRLISANTALINSLAQETAKSANSYISTVGDEIALSIGTMSGIAALSGRGPKIRLNIVPTGSVVCVFLSEFEGAGINQTRHKIYLEVLTSVVLVLPTKKVEFFNTVEVLISENIIVGEVPDAFLRVSTLGGTAYDLVPH